jgi:hypothetical protein
MTWLVLLTTLSAAPCPQGQSMNAETAGHCCWGGQVWSKLQNRCVGAPACPAGMRAEGDQCVADCPAGQTQNPDTEGHCCWSNQVWSRTRGVCVGVPACPAGFAPSGETCVAAASAPPPAVQPPPPPQYPQAPPQYGQQPQYQQPPPPPQYPQQPPPQYGQPQYGQPQYGQPQYGQPQYGQPQYPPSPQLTPNQTKTAQLRAELVDLQARRAKLGFGGGIVGLAVGIPSTALGFFALSLARKESDVVWSTLLIITGSVLTIAGAIDIPVTAARRSSLSRQIAAKEKELAASERLGLLPRMDAPLAMTFGLSSPVFTF